MNGGTIDHNNAASLGGGVSVEDSTFRMNGGTVSDNTAGADGTHGGGGVYVSKTYNSAAFEMSGNAVISDNTTTGSGGGVYVNTGASFAISGDAAISGNEASLSGGGVAVVTQSTFTMSGNAKIGGNEAAGGNGGGVFVSWNNCTFTKTGGTIYGSNETDSALKNTASGDGHAVYLLQNSGNNQKRNTTAGPEANLDSTKTGVEGGWE
jgi:hypothetical protein